MKNALTQPVWNFSKYRSEKNDMSLWITCAGNRSMVCRKKQGTRYIIILHQSMVQVWQPWCWPTLAHWAVLCKPLGHSRVLLQPWSLHSIWHLKHLCSMCLSWETTCGPPGTCSWDRTQLLQSTQGALSEATVQEHPHAWQEVAPALNLGLVQCSWEEPYLPHHAEGTDNWLHNIFRYCKTQTGGKESSRILS